MKYENGTDASGSGGALTAAAIDALTAADDEALIVVPGTQSSNLRKATLRPSNQIASWADVLALTGMSAGDLHWLPGGVLGENPVQIIYTGTRWLPISPIEWRLYGTVASPVCTARTTSGFFALASGGSTTLVAPPANLLRVGSRFEFNAVVQRTDVGTGACDLRLIFGTSSASTIRVAGDSMSGTASTEGVFRGWMRITGTNTVYTSWSGTSIGANQAGVQEVTDATHVNLGAAGFIGLNAATVAATTTLTLMDLSVKLWV